MSLPIRNLRQVLLAPFGSKGRHEFISTLRSHRFSFLISLFITALGLAAYIAIVSKSENAVVVFLDNVEAKTLDARFQYRGRVEPSPEVVIVAVDQKTIDRFGAWPFPRSHYARMLDTLTGDGARVVGFDIDFPFPAGNNAALGISQLEGEYKRTHGANPNREYMALLRDLQQQQTPDAQFAKAIQEAGNVVLGHLFFEHETELAGMDPERVKEYDEVLAFQAYPQTRKLPAKDNKPYDFKLDKPVMAGVEPNLRMFAEAAKSYGAFNFEADNDGTFRKAPMIFRYKPSSDPSADEDFYPSLDVEVTRVYLGAGPQETILWFNETQPELIELGGGKVYPDVEGNVLINYAGPAGTFPYYSLADVADGLTPKGTFKDKIVFVGPTATGIGDMRPTPYTKQSYPGVEIHANVVDNILRNRFLRHGGDEEVIDLWVMLLFCGPLMGLLFVMVPPLTSTLVFMLAETALLGLVYYQFQVNSRWIALALPASILTLKYLSVVIYRVLTEEKEKKRIRGMFGKFVSPDYVAQLEKRPELLKLGGEEVELTVLFSDIRGFTSISEKLTPSELVSLLNEYLTAMTDIVRDNGGTLDKYIGDAVMAFWGRPLPVQDHAVRACRAALEMSNGLRKLNAGWAAQGRPLMKIGIGLNTGPMINGNMGSRDVFNYTVMGDHVNLGSRVESLTKEYGVQILLTETTYEHVTSQFITRELDMIRVKGKNQPVAIYELLAPASEREQYEVLLKEFKQGLAEYKAGRWDPACEVFEQLAAKYPSDGPTRLFLKRSRQFLEAAPEGAWDGVFTMATK